MVIETVVDLLADKRQVALENQQIDRRSKILEIHFNWAYIHEPN